MATNARNFVIKKGQTTFTSYNFPLHKERKFETVDHFTVQVWYNNKGPDLNHVIARIFILLEKNDNFSPFIIIKQSV